MKGENQNHFLYNEADNKKAPITTAILVLIIFLLVVGLALYFITTSEKEQKSKQIESPKQEEYTLQDYKNSLLNDSELQLPETENMESILMSELPSDLLFFIDQTSELSDLEIKKVSYKDGNNGYQINYQTKNSELRDSYSKISSILREDNDWEIAQGRRTKLFAIIETQSSNYNVYILQNQVDLIVETQITIILK